MSELPPLPTSSNDNSIQSGLFNGEIDPGKKSGKIDPGYIFPPGTDPEVKNPNGKKRGDRKSISKGDLLHMSEQQRIEHSNRNKS